MSTEVLSPSPIHTFAMPTTVEAPGSTYNPNVDPIPNDPKAINGNLARAKIPPINKDFKYLTPEDVSHFLTKGWILVPNAIKPEYLDKWVRDLWTRIDVDPNDKTTWTMEYKHVGRQREVLASELTPDAWRKIVELAGGDHMIDPDRERRNGDNFIINFGTEEKAKISTDQRPQDKSGWHTDDDWYRQFLDSSGNGMTVIQCWSDIPPRGGGTLLCEDGIAGVCEFLYNHPEGLDPGNGREKVCGHVKDCHQFKSVVGKKGDVFITHGLLPHTVGPNYLHYPRIITNPHVCLANPHNLNRADGNYSLLEQVILRAMGRTSVPEWKPTRERMWWYPRNSGFKRVNAPGEAERLVKAAVARGKDPSTVDAIYRVKGSPEYHAFERRNGFKLPINDSTGLLMEQHAYSK